MSNPNDLKQILIDAARYRWIREWAGFAGIGLIPHYLERGFEDECADKWPELLDAAIDEKLNRE